MKNDEMQEKSSSEEVSVKNRIGGTMLLVGGTLLFVVLPIFLFILFLTNDISDREYFANTITAQATVVRTEKHKRVTRRLYVDYEYEGMQYRSIDLGKSNNADHYKVGDTVTVYFYPDSPGKARMKPDPEPYFALLIFPGGILTVAIIGLVSKHREEERKRNDPLYGTSAYNKDKRT